MIEIMERRNISWCLWNKIKEGRNSSEKVIVVCNWLAIPEILKTHLHRMFLFLTSTRPFGKLYKCFSVIRTVISGYIWWIRYPHLAPSLSNASAPPLCHLWHVCHDLYIHENLATDKWPSPLCHLWHVCQDLYIYLTTDKWPSVLDWYLGISVKGAFLSLHRVPWQCLYPLSITPCLKYNWMGRTFFEHSVEPIPKAGFL